MTDTTCLILTENFRVVRCDDRNLEVEEYREVITRPNRYVKEKSVSKRWVSIGYYSDLPCAINGVLKATENSLTMHEKLELRDIVSELQGLSDELKDSVRESGIKLTDFVKATDGRGKVAKEVTVAKVNATNADKTTAAKSRRSKKVTT